MSKDEIMQYESDCHVVRQAICIYDIRRYEQKLFEYPIRKDIILRFGCEQYLALLDNRNRRSYE